MSQQTSRAESLFKAAVELASAEDRSAFLERECAGDAGMREAVEVLLRERDRAGGNFHDAPTVIASLDATMPMPQAGNAEGKILAHPLHGGKVAGRAASSGAKNAPVKAPASDEPAELRRHLPQYRVRELIGRGGMGYVMKVDDPKLTRTVALKTMKLGPDATGEIFGENTATVTSLAIHPDGLKALWGDYLGYVHAVDLRDGRLLFSTRAHAGMVRHLAFTPDGDRFVSAAPLPDGRQSIQIANARTGAPLQTLIGGSGEATGFVAHPVSGELLIGGPNSRLWDVSGTTARWVLPVTDTGGQSLGGAAFLGSDDLLLGPAEAQRAALVDLRGPATLWKPASGGFSMPTVSADGRFVAFGNWAFNAGRVLVFRRKDQMFEPIGDFKVTGNFVALRLSPTGDRVALATNGDGNQTSVIEPSTGELLVALDRKSLPAIRDLHWLGNGTQLIALATANANRGLSKSEERIIVWDAASGQRVRSAVHPTALDCMVVAPDGKRFAAAGADKLVHVFDTETLAERQAFRAHDGPITALAWHPARPIVATASEDLTIKLWNLDNGRRLETLRGPTDTPRALNFSPSGQRLACASVDRAVRIWEPPSLNNATLDAPKTDGWEDLLAKLKADDVKANGNGWTLSGGVLMSSVNPFAALPLSGNYARTSYQVQVTLRSLKPQNFFAVVLPVADQQVCFYLDGYPKEGFWTGISMVDNNHHLDLPGAVHGQQTKDTEPHDLEISVQLSARTARITATLDERPLYEWTGPVASLSLGKLWPALPQPNLFLGASSGDWVVSAVKVKRVK